MDQRQAQIAHLEARSQSRQRSLNDRDAAVISALFEAPPILEQGQLSITPTPTATATAMSEILSVGLVVMRKTRPIKIPKDAPRASANTGRARVRRSRLDRLPRGRLHPQSHAVGVDHERTDRRKEQEALTIGARARDHV